MNRYLLLYLLASIWGNCKAQYQSLDSINNYYVHVMSRQFNDQHFTNTHYEFFDRATYQNSLSSNREPLFSCKWIDYGPKAVGGEHVILVFLPRIDQSQDVYSSNLNHILSYIATRHGLSKLTDISLELPMELSISVSSKLEKELGHIRRSHTKLNDKIQKENELFKQELIQSPLYTQINRILAKYKMEICDIQFIEPTLLYSKKKVKELFKQYVNDDLPEYVLGLHINLTIKTYIGHQ
ncbi:hypothetical protein [Prevotella sp. P6B4]|uniref:hypothetical protein n=1 Tax=Prevotella sp. P6B4 TaxID=1410614 RepID=UPI00048AF586|nr:hypothetical protein [Prevotella sp. P6B4]